MKPKTITNTNTEPEFVEFCPECNAPVYAGENKFWCNNRHNGSCSFEIKRRYFTKCGNNDPISVGNMRRLIRGGCIPLFGLIFQTTEGPLDCVGFLEFSEKGRWWIKFNFEHFALGVFRQKAANKN